MSEYPSLTVRIPHGTHSQLHCLSVLKNTPVWQLVNTAALSLIRELPADERKLLARLAAVVLAQEKVKPGAKKFPRPAVVKPRLRRATAVERSVPLCDESSPLTATGMWPATAAKPWPLS